MTRTELIFMFLAEEATIEFVDQEQPKDLVEHKKTAKKEGKLAETHLKLYEKETGKKVVSSSSFLPENRDKYIKR